MNTILNEMKNDANYKQTENGGTALASTRSAVLDMFAMCGAYRSRSNEDCILAFKNALEEDMDLALKCLFYLADCRGGQGERRFFRVCFKWFANNYPIIAKKLIPLIPEYRRWDDLIYSCADTLVAAEMLAFVKEQLSLDVESRTPSLLAKWLPSENASSKETKKMGTYIRSYLNMTHKEYRKTLSVLRTRINIVEKLMSENRWDEIEFDKIPSKAGMIYKNAFARRDIIAKKYETFAKDKNTTVNAGTLYPYEIVSKVINSGRYYTNPKLSETDRAMLEKFWENLPDYFGGKQSNMLCVVDTSGSMVRGDAAAPINVAISLGMYAAERAGGPFKDHYISFSATPKLVKIEGVDFADKVYRIYRTNLCQNTNLTGVFDMLLDVATRNGVKKEDVPNTIIVISDMEIDSGANGNSYWWGSKVAFNSWTKANAMTEMDKVRAKWAAAGLELPRLVYWNVDARQNTILDAGPAVTYVSGMSPTIFQSIITGKNGYDLMLEVLMKERYEPIKSYLK